MALQHGLLRKEREILRTLDHSKATTQQINPATSARRAFSSWRLLRAQVQCDQLRRPLAHAMRDIVLYDDKILAHFVHAANDDVRVPVLK